MRSLFGLLSFEQFDESLSKPLVSCFTVQTIHQTLSVLFVSSRVRPITAEKNISANDIASYWGEEGLSRREGDGKTAPSDDLEGGLRVPRHVAFVMDGNGRW